MASLVVAAACAPTTTGRDSGPAACEFPALGQDVAARYAEGVAADYARVLTLAQAMKTAVDGFVAAPSANGLEAARTAWLTARLAYGETEVFRFYGGPIDDETSGVEGQVNAWPMDEAYVDYVEGSATAGIINDANNQITGASLLALNEQGGEENVATGWHAIEFLLWGQDQSAVGPGARPFTDYVTAAGGTATNADRRRQYLGVVTEQLIVDLTALRDAWAPGAAYRTSFLADSKVAVGRMLRGMGALGGAELAGERMSVAYEEKEQEDEHSCFSDNTHNDIISNARGIQNVWLGRYSDGTSGVGLKALVSARNEALANRLDGEIAASMTAVNVIPPPFDQAILGEDSATGRTSIRAAIEALRTQTDTLVEAATAVCIQLSVEVE